MSERPTIYGFFAPPAWTEEALCAETDPALFFPEHNGIEGASSEARKVCAVCPVRRDCLEYALEYESGAMGTAMSYSVNGIWGGKTPNERRAIMRRRAVA